MEVSTLALVNLFAIFIDSTLSVLHQIGRNVILPVTDQMTATVSQMRAAKVACATHRCTSALTRYQHNECYTLPSPRPEK